MARPLRFLLSGPGLIGRKHAQLLLNREDATLSAIVAPANRKNLDFIESCGSRHFDSVEKALESESFDAAVISSPNAFHCDQALACIEHRLPTLVEKPLADTLENAARIYSTSTRLSVPVLVGHHRTHSPLLSLAKSYLCSPKFGRLVSVHGSALFYKPTQYFEDGPWRTKKGGGPILINLIHEIGFLRCLAGEIVSVSASSSSEFRKFEVEDTVAMIFTFASGAVGTFVLSDTAASSKSWEMTAGENPAYPTFPDEDCYHFAGDMGSLDFPSMRTRSYLGHGERSWWKEFQQDALTPSRRDPLLLQMDHFMEVVRGNADPLVSARDGYLNMLVLDAICLASKERRTIEISEVAASAQLPALAS